MSNSSNDLFDMLFKLVLKNTFVPNKTGPNDNRVENQLQLAALALLAFVGADALKTVFRKNFGSNGLSLLRVVISFVAFCLIAVLGFILNQPNSNINEAYGSRESYFFVSIFYLGLAFYVLIKGIKHKKASQAAHINPDYKGDSHLLSGLITTSGWSQANVQNWAEPLLTIAVGVVLALINVLWELPIIFCALSIWGYQVVEYLFGQNQVDEKIRKSGYQNPNDDFTQIHY
jgi:hypothetical protein